MKIVLLFAFSFIVVTSFGQQKISLEEVKDHINDSVEVNGKVSRITYLKDAKDKPTIISVGGTSSNPILSIIIPGEVRKKLGYNPLEKKYQQGMVVATGKIKMLQGKPGMVIQDPKQLVFIYDEEVPASEIPPIQQ
jgi:hypothetical protein